MDSALLERSGLHSVLLGPSGLDSALLERSGLDSGLLGPSGLDSVLLGLSGLDSVQPASSAPPREPQMLCWLVFGEHEALGRDSVRVGIFIPA